MVPMDVEDGSDAIGADLEDDRTSASPPSPPEESSSETASEVNKALAASTPRDDHGDPHGERVADVEARSWPSAADNPARTPLTTMRRGLPRCRALSNEVEQISEVSALVEQPMAARAAHILMMLSSSCVPLVRLRRP